MRSIVPGVLTVALLLSNGHASAGEWSVGLAGGVVKPNDFPHDSRYWSAVVRARPSNTPLAVDLEIGYWSKSWEFSATDYGIYVYDRAARRDLHLGFNVLAETPGERCRFSIGGGLGPHSVRNEITNTTNYDYQPEGNSTWNYSHTETKLGIHGLVGLDIVLAGRLGVFANARYDLLKGEAQNEVKYYVGLRVNVVKAAPPTRPR
jgi:hypothetical protein